MARKIGGFAMLSVTYFHPVQNHDGKILSTANIIWAQRDCGDSYYSYSKFAMKAGKFPANHPCAPFDSQKQDSDKSVSAIMSSQFGDSERLRAFRARGYWASCFPEGDGITLKWWQDVAEPTEKNADEVMQDIRECFGWEVVLGPAGR